MVMCTRCPGLLHWRLYAQAVCNTRRTYMADKPAAMHEATGSRWLGQVGKPQAQGSPQGEAACRIHADLVLLAAVQQAPASAEPGEAGQVGAAHWVWPATAAAKRGVSSTPTHHPQVACMRTGCSCPARARCLCEHVQRLSMSTRLTALHVPKAVMAVCHPFSYEWSGSADLQSPAEPYRHHTAVMVRRLPRRLLHFHVETGAAAQQPQLHAPRCRQHTSVLDP